MTIYREKMFDKISKDLIILSKVVFKQLKYVADKLASEDALIYSDDIAANEAIIDSLEVKIRKNVIATVLFYSPRASDLRKIMACYDITVSLERIGDLIQNIDNSLSDIDFSNNVYSSVKASVRELLVLTEAMVKDSIYSFVQEDLELSSITFKKDDAVDELYDKISNQLITISADKVHSANELEELFALKSISHNIERIADYSTNIVEAAVYLIEGKNMLHKDISSELNS